MHHISSEAQSKDIRKRKAQSTQDVEDTSEPQSQSVMDAPQHIVSYLQSLGYDYTLPLILQQSPLPELRDVDDSDAHQQLMRQQY